jgi:hypothetical protein
MARKTELGVQTAIRLPQDVYDRLKQSEHGVSEEIRRRLAQSFALDADPETSRLMAAIGRVATLIRLQTNHLDWHSHPAAHWIMRHAITARLARLKPEGEPVFAPDELPKARLVNSDDPQAMGQALEAIDFHSSPISEQRAWEFTLKELREHQKKSGGKS